MKLFSKHRPLGDHKRNARICRFGAATIEMALVAPFIFLLIFGSVELARLMSVRQGLTNAAREGCRKACLATTQNDDDADAVIRTSLSGLMRNVDDPQVVRISFDPSFNTSPASGTKIVASIEVDSSSVTLVPPFFGDTLIRASATMKRE